MSGPAATPGPGSFAVLLRSLREHAALTQEELADRAGLTVKAVGALERGERRRPYPHTVRALADALRLDEPSRTALAQAARPTPRDSPPPVRTAVAEPTTPLLGREEERRQVAAGLRSPGTRLLTITGPGGVGKTRLALSVAASAAPDFPGGVALAELAAVREVGLVLATVGRALGLTQLAPADVIEAVAAVVAGRRQLLVVDNLEHLLDAAPDLAALLDRCPDLVVLATSRAPLRLRLEQEHPLAPLALPRTADLDAVAASPAAQMFLERARAVSPALELDPVTAPAVAAICRRLDGLPLALELAAAHARLLPPADLLDRLSSALEVVRSRDLPERQRTMTATLDWSHALLTRDEQQLLRRLSVFAGGFTLTAAEQVTGAEEDLLPSLAGLVEQSLVTPEPAPERPVAAAVEVRYRMLEPVREYAGDRLRAAGEVHAWREQHARHYCALGRQAHDGLRCRAQSEWLDRLDREHGNLRAAVGTLRERGDLAALARLGADTWLYWVLRGHAGEALGWLEAVVHDGRAGALSDADVAAAHLGLAGLRYAAGDVAGTRAAATTAADRARGAGLELLLSDALMLQGSAAVFQGDLTAAVAPLAESARRASAADDAFGRAHALSAQGQLHFQAGDLAASTAALADAEVIAREHGLPFTLALVLNMQAVTAEVSGADDLALEQLSEAAELAAEVGTTWTLVYTLPALAVLAARRGRFDLAAVLFTAGTATAQASSLAVSFPPSREGAEHWWATVRRELDPASREQAAETGRALRAGGVAGLVEQLRRSAPA